MKTLFLKLKNELWLVLIFTTLFCFSKNNPHLNSKPNWVKEVAFSDSKNKEQVGGYRYLLVDTQDNLITQTVFRHYVININNYNSYSCSIS